jgi:hypothetical protein
MATHNYTTKAGNSVINGSQFSGNFTAMNGNVLSGLALTDADILITVNGKEINVGATLAELDMYKIAFTRAFKELGIDINEIIDKQKFLDRLSS